MTFAISSRLLKCWLVWLVTTAATTNTTTHAAPWFGSSSDDTAGSNKNTDHQPVRSSSSSLVSPIVNRELETSVVAHAWPSNPQSVFCEAYAYHQATYSNDGPRQQLTAEEAAAAVVVNEAFLEALSVTLLQKLEEEGEDVTIPTYAAARDLVRNAVVASLQPSSSSSSSSSNPPSNVLLLEYVLSMRAHSPQCELHRGLARQTLQQRHQLATFRDRNVFAVVYPGGHIVLEEDLVSGDFDWTSLAHDVVTDNDDDPDDLLLPGEFPFGEDRSFEDDAAQLVILYANFGTVAFAKTYQQLHRAISTTQQKQNLRFVVRHLGAVHYEELGADATTQPTVLQGYGVRLDIRNAEYKVFDDRKSDASASEDDVSLMNLTALEATNTLKPPSQFLAGVNVTAVVGLVEDESKKNAILKELWKKHEAQQANLIPPTWQRRKLSLQATSVIAASKDPLMTLEEVSLNLPSVASTLVHRKIPDEIQEIAEKMEDELGTVLPASGALLINGRHINIDRPTFNVFELINVLRKEQSALEKFQAEVGPYLTNSPGALRKVKDAWTMGSDFFDTTNNSQEQGFGGVVEPESKSFRIDVGRGWKQAIIYLNDIEKDAKYAQWPRSVRQMFMAMQYGMAPSVRRNFFTLLAVINPIQSNQNVGFTLAKQLMQSNYPARLGVLLVDDADVQACAEWVSANPASETGEACPVMKGPVIQDDITAKDKEKLKDIPGTTRALHSLFADLVSKNPSDMADAYLEYVMKLIDEQKEMSGEDSLSMFDIVEMHVNTMSGMQMGSSSKHWSDALSLLTDAEEDDDDTTRPTYAKALRFAVDKGLQAGMSFVNGRPLPMGDPEDVFEKAGKIFNEEMSAIFMKIQGGEIKDSTPKSVYGLFLSGKGVFKKVHPLLMDSRDKSDSYIKVPHEFDSKSLLFPAASEEEVGAVFVLDAVLDVGSSQGLQLAKSLVSVMDSFPASIADSGEATVGVKIGYRIIPSKASDNAKALCPILANAREVGAPGLTKVLEKAASAGGTSLSISDLLEALPELSGYLKEKMQTDLNEGVCSRLATLKDPPGDNLIVSNGLYYVLEGSSMAKDDVELLLSLDLGYSKAVTLYLKDNVSVADPEGCESVARCITFLAMEAAVAQFDRVGLEKEIIGLEKKLGVDENPLRFSWNEDGGNGLQVCTEADK